jgi:signal transduction histidine kinase
MLETVVRNLISNAIKFTHQGGSITVSASQKPANVDITIADTGVGMSEVTIDHLFKIDESRSTTGTHNESGTGLGLIICKEFVERHGGSIVVESEIGKGSQFRIMLPVAV